MHVTPSNKEPKEAEPTISIEASARLLEISVERVRQLIKADYVPRPAPGKTTLVGAVRGYIRFLKDEDRRSTKSAADSRVRDARALEIETRVAERRRDLVPRHGVEASNAFVVGLVNHELNELPARLTRDGPTRRQYQIEIGSAQARLAKALVDAAEYLETGKPLPGSAGDG